MGEFSCNWHYSLKNKLQRRSRGNAKRGGKKRESFQVFCFYRGVTEAWTKKERNWGTLCSSGHLMRWHIYGSDSNPATLTCELTKPPIKEKNLNQSADPCVKQALLDWVFFWNIDTYICIYMYTYVWKKGSLPFCLSKTKYKLVTPCSTCKHVKNK